MIRRDYILRMIEECIRALARINALKKGAALGVKPFASHFAGYRFKGRLVSVPFGPVIGTNRTGSTAYLSTLLPCFRRM